MERMFGIDVVCTWFPFSEQRLGLLKSFSLPSLYGFDQYVEPGICRCKFTWNLPMDFDLECVAVGETGEFGAVVTFSFNVFLIIRVAPRTSR